MIYKSYKWCWAVHPSQQAKVNDPKAAVTMKIKAMKTTKLMKLLMMEMVLAMLKKMNILYPGQGQWPLHCCCCGQLCTRTRLLSFTDFNAFFDFNHFQCGRSQTWEIFHRWQQNMSVTIFCSGTTFVSVEIKLGWSLSQICIAVMLLGGSSILGYPVVVVSVPMFQCFWEWFWEAWVSQKKGALLCITRQKLVSAGRGCSKQQGKCKLCSKPARQGRQGEVEQASSVGKAGLTPDRVWARRAARHTVAFGCSHQTTGAGGSQGRGG